MSSENLSGVTINDFYNQLADRVSAYNARLLIQRAVLQSGLGSSHEEQLNVDDAKAICLELIKKGGPAFQVGKDMYTRFQ
ncbi:MAG: hypothetical protein H6624_10135 [Bdellovibrionaceae bacterium]|nr:hypothetical protein [Bdellovibrionales bacterium]MCB9084692.1 hypothetical protein [Pseudobdellovibrionaceae bacterium]